MKSVTLTFRRSHTRSAGRDGDSVGHRRPKHPQAGTLAEMASNLDAFRPEAGAHMLFSFQRPSALSSTHQKSGRTKGLSAERPTIEPR